MVLRWKRVFSLCYPSSDTTSLVGFPVTLVTTYTAQCPSCQPAAVSIRHSEQPLTRGMLRGPCWWRGRIWDLLSLPDLIFIIREDMKEEDETAICETVEYIRFAAYLSFSSSIQCDVVDQCSGFTQCHKKSESGNAADSLISALTCLPGAQK